MRALISTTSWVSTQIEHDLRKAGMLVTAAESTEDLLELMPLVGDAVIIVDTDLADASWGTLLARLRAVRPGAPLMAICATTRLEDEVAALTCGADDVLSPRMDQSELMARVMRLAARRAGFSTPVLGLGGLQIDMLHQSVTWRGHAVPLTPSQYHILERLALRAGGYVGNDEMLDLLYGAESAAEPQAIRVFVSHLRKRLRAAGAAAVAIDCVTKLGFRIRGEGPVSAVHPYLFGAATPLLKTA